MPKDMIPEGYKRVGWRDERSDVISLPTRILRGGIEERAHVTYDFDLCKYVPVVEFHRGDTCVPRDAAYVTDEGLEFDFDIDDHPIPLVSPPGAIQPGSRMGAISRAMAHLYPTGGDDESGDGGIPVEVLR